MRRYLIQMIPIMTNNSPFMKQQHQQKRQPVGRKVSFCNDNLNQYVTTNSNNSNSINSSNNNHNSLNRNDVDLHQLHQQRQQEEMAKRIFCSRSTTQMDDDDDDVVVDIHTATTNLQQQ